MSYLTRIINNTTELIKDYSNKEQWEMLLPKFKEIVNKIHIVNNDYRSFLTKESIDDEIKGIKHRSFTIFRCEFWYKGFQISANITPDTVICQFAKNSLLN